MRVVPSHLRPGRHDEACARVRPVDREVLQAWATTRMAAFTTAAAAGWLLARGDVVLPFLDRWRQWDVVHYEAIARGGYTTTHDPGTPLAAFFPGQPVLARLVSLVGLPLTAAGLVVSAAACLVAALALGRLAELDGGRANGGRADGVRAVWLMLLSPAAVFLAAGYAEALFLAFAVPAWIGARRGRWAVAGLLASGAALTRVNGLFLLAGLVVLFLTGRPRPAWTDLAWLALPIAVLLGYAAYLQIAFGDPLAWLHAQAQGWGRRLVNPVTALHTTWGAAFGHSQPPPYAWMFSLELLAVAAGVLVTGWLLVRGSYGEATYVGLSVVAMATATWYLSVVRATLLWFPLWLELATATRRWPWAWYAYLAVVAPVSVLLVAVFTTGGWAG